SFCILSLGVQSIQQTIAKQSNQKWTPDFHDKYCDAILAGGATFCVAVWLLYGHIQQHKLE
uniref:Cytochrome c oxidase subunit 7B, mitochondrial n=1 Tax=Lynx canadensis TaxID=61383 RepID=A0A667HMB0_LYNCA